MRLLNPIAPTTFLVRNLGKTIPLVSVIILAVMLVQSIIALINSIPFSIRTIYRYTDAMLGVSPRGDTSQTPALVKDLVDNSPVPIDRAMFCRASATQVKSIVGKWPFVTIGLKPDDLEYYLKRQGATRIDGRLPKVGAPEAVISTPVATNLQLKIGDTLMGPEVDGMYSPMEVKIVGIAQTDRWVMVNDIDYQKANHFPPVDLAIICAKNRADQDKLDAWAQERVKGKRAQVFAYREVEKDAQTMFEILYQILNAVIAILTIVITLMVGMLMNIYQSQRLVEFGLLQAIGHTKKTLVKRVLFEACLVIVIGWILGLGAAQTLLRVLKRILMEPRAFALDLGDPISFAYTVPIPICILVVSFATIMLRFKKFDPVAVVERRIV